MNLLNAIPYGAENAVSRAELVRITGISDRNLRKAVKKLNNELCRHGEAILSSSGKKGYWRTADIREMEEYIRELNLRAARLRQNASPIISLIYRSEHITVVPVKAHFRKIRRQSELKDQFMF